MNTLNAIIALILLTLLCLTANSQLKEEKPQQPGEKPDNPLSVEPLLPSESARRLLPPNGCLKDYINCPNACHKSSQTCCWCEECWNKAFGLTQTCSCCPQGYKCCPRSNVAPPIGQSQKCCPKNTDCGPVNTDYCVTRQPALYQSPTCQNCAQWYWPPTIVSVQEAEAKEL